MINPGAALYSQALGTVPAGPNFPVYMTTAPTSTTIQGPFGVFLPGQVAIIQNVAVYFLLGYTSIGGTLSANWVEVSTASGAILSVTGTANEITASTTAGAVNLSIPSTFDAPGSVTAATTLTATSGAITATNGNLVLGTAGNKIISTSVGSTTSAGANSFGTVALVAGTATVDTTAVTASSIIFLTRLVAAGTSGSGAIGMLSVGTITAGTSFVINALTTADLATVVTNDISTVGWMIVN